LCPIGGKLCLRAKKNKNFNNVMNNEHNGVKRIMNEIIKIYKHLMSFFLNLPDENLHLRLEFSYCVNNILI